MLEAIGIAAIAVVVGVGVLVASLRVMDNLRWWADAGLGAFIPMLAVAVPVSILAAGIAVFLVSK